MAAAVLPVRQILEEVWAAEIPAAERHGFGDRLLLALACGARSPTMQPARAEPPHQREAGPIGQVAAVLCRLRAASGCKNQHIGDAVRFLRRHGAHSLAKRVRRASSARNFAAHPDQELDHDVGSWLEGWMAETKQGEGSTTEGNSESEVGKELDSESEGESLDNILAAFEYPEQTAALAEKQLAWHPKPKLCHERLIGHGGFYVEQQLARVSPKEEIEQIASAENHKYEAYVDSGRGDRAISALIEKESSFERFLGGHASEVENFGERQVIEAKQRVEGGARKHLEQTITEHSLAWAVSGPPESMSKSARYKKVKEEISKLLESECPPPPGHEDYRRLAGLLAEEHHLQEQMEQEREKSR